jgi:uncharacterized membrane protein
MALRLEPTFFSQLNAIHKEHYKLITFKILELQIVTITPYLWSLSLTYDNEWVDINVDIEYECNITKYVSKLTKTNNRTCFLLHPDLYSTYN